MSALLIRIRRYSRTNPYGDASDVIHDMSEEEDWQAMEHITFGYLHRTFDTSIPRDVLKFLQEEVWGNVFRTTFWNEGPLERFTVTMISHVDEFGIRVLSESVVNGAKRDRMACNVHVWIKKHILTLNETEMLLFCQLMCMLAEDNKACECLSDVQLFRDMSERGKDSHDIMESVLDVFLVTDVTDFSHTFLLAERAAQNLILDFTRVNQIYSFGYLLKSLRLLERLAALMEWHSFMSAWVVSLSRYGWPLIFGTLVANMLSTPSVQFVIDLHRAQKLDFLIRMSHKHVETTRDAAWRIVRGRLRVLWPTRFAGVLNLHGVCKIGSSTGYECPITLQECMYPIVASDGHTYERDALLRILATENPLSPVTKTQLSFVVFDNYAICK